MSLEPIPCDTCFWIAPRTLGQRPIWCAHSVWHGWHNTAKCKGKGWQKETRFQKVNDGKPAP